MINFDFTVVDCEEKAGRDTNEPVAVAEWKEP